MQTIINIADSFSKSENLVFLISDIKNLNYEYFSSEELDYIRLFHKEHKKNLFAFNKLNNWFFVQFIEKERNRVLRFENYRVAGGKILNQINENKLNSIVVVDTEAKPEESLSFAEGVALNNYQFLKYKKESAKKLNSLNTVYIYSENINQKNILYSNFFP